MRGDKAPVYQVAVANQWVLGQVQCLQAPQRLERSIRNALYLVVVEREQVEVGQASENVSP